MKKIGVTVHEPMPENVEDHQLRFDISDRNGMIEQGQIVQSRVFDLQDGQILQIATVVPPVKPA